MSRYRLSGEIGLESGSYSGEECVFESEKGYDYLIRGWKKKSIVDLNQI